VEAGSSRDLAWEGCFNARDLGGLRAAGLRNDDELLPDAAPRPDSVETVHVALDVSEDREFWGEWGSGPQFGTPLYFGPHIRRFPERSSAAIAAIARAEPGGVAFHCVGGRDRSGQVAMLVLALVGVSAEEIAADYALSAPRLRALYESRGEPDHGAEIEPFLAARGTTATEAILTTLSQLDAEAALREGGLTDADLSALRERLLER